MIIGGKYLAWVLSGLEIIWQGKFKVENFPCRVGIVRVGVSRQELPSLKWELPGNHSLRRENISGDTSTMRHFALLLVTNSNCLSIEVFMKKYLYWSFTEVFIKKLFEYFYLSIKFSMCYYLA